MKLWCSIVQVRTLVCVVLSVLMSLRLQNAISQVEHNNLDVYVTRGQDDELGQPLGISGYLPMTAAFPEERSLHGPQLYEAADLGGVLRAERGDPL